MSAVDESGEVWKPFLMRSSTPGPNEKVLNWVETMSREGVDTTPPASLFEHDGPRSRTPSQRAPSNAGPFSPAKSHRSELRNVAEGADEIDSNAQERSDAGQTETPVHEPGPQDPPGPRAKYESQETAPSFGNKGPMPAEDISFTNPYAPTWQPNWGAQSNTATPRNGATNGLPTSPSNGAAGVALPASTVGPSRVASPQDTINIAVESPSQSTKSRTRSHAPSQQAPSERARSPPTSPRPASRTGTAQPPPEEPWSPKSQARSRVTAVKSPTGSQYPPLPSTRNGGDDWDAPMSPKSQAYSKAPSVSPSDSLSQFKPRKDKSVNGNSRAPQQPASVLSGGNHQNRPFSPYRHAPTNEDLLHAATRGRGLVIPEESEKALSTIEEKRSKAPSAAPSAASRHTKQPSVVSHARSKQPTVVTQHSQSPSKAPSKAKSPLSPAREADDLNADEARMVEDVLANNQHDATPRTSYYAASVLEPDVVNSHFHDNDLCVLLHQESDPNVHEVVKRALRKAIRQRVKKLGMKIDNESIKEYKRAHAHDGEENGDFNSEEPPKWAADIKRELVLMQQRIESLGPKIENLRPASPGSYQADSRYDHAYEGDETRTPMTQTVNIHTQPGTLADSMYQPPESELVVDEEPVDNFDEADREFNHTPTPRQPYPGSANHEYGSEGQRDDSPGQMFLEEELYKLRQKPSSEVHSPLSHASWDVKPAGEPDDDDHNAPAPSGLPTIPDSNADAYSEQRAGSPPLPPVPQNQLASPGPQSPQAWNPADVSAEAQQLPPWQRIHQRLLNWAIIWPSSELDAALNSTTRGHQVDEVALSIWATQTYKRYVRARLMDSPPGVVDRLFVPPNMADAISNAVFNGRHGDACGMLRDLWHPFGLEGMPRLLVVLAKHRSDPNHWVVHRFSLPDGALTTYDTYPERTLPDGRPLGWWFAIRIAWPNAIYPSPDHLMQKMVRLHRPMQLPIDNSVAAAGIWRNVLMGSRAERSLDLERLRDLINTEVKNLRQRKQVGKLSIASPRPAWQDMS
ncbi:hypothetical protein FB107DRAFT_246331 [Schizophyllum commune]